jgi:hypothetical protein
MNQHSEFLFDNDGSELPIQMTYKLDGKIATDGNVDLSELIKSLDGFERILLIIERLYIQDQPAKRLIKNRHRIRSIIGPPQKGSWEAILLTFISIQASAYAPEIRKTNDAAGEWLWNQLKNMANFIFDNIEAAIDTKMLAEFLLKEMLLHFENKFSDFDLATTVRLLVDALQDFTEPLEKSATQLYLSHNQSFLTIGKNERDAITSILPDADDVESCEILKVPIRFIRLNLKTGRGLINFIDCPNKQKHCVIIDENFYQPRNRYASAFANEEWLIVEAIEVNAANISKQNYWRLISTTGETVEFTDDTLIDVGLE